MTEKTKMQKKGPDDSLTGPVATLWDLREGWGARKSEGLKSSFSFVEVGAVQRCYVLKEKKKT